MYLLHNGIRSCTKGCSWQWWCLSELDKNVEWCLKCLQSFMLKPFKDFHRLCSYEFLWPWLSNFYCQEFLSFNLFNFSLDSFVHYKLVLFIYVSIFDGDSMLMISLFSVRIPMKAYVLLAFLTVATMGLSNTSVGYLNYPTQVIFKCCKLIPVLIGGIIIQSKCSRNYPAGYSVSRFLFYWLNWKQAFFFIWLGLGWLVCQKSVQCFFSGKIWTC